MHSLIANLDSFGNGIWEDVQCDILMGLTADEVNCT